jgi:hypothetical protein
MRRRGVLVTLASIAALSAIFSCAPQRRPTVPASVVADTKSAFAIMPDLPLWMLSGGALTFKESIPIGEKIELLGQTDTAVQSGKQREFSLVRRPSGTEGWVRADLVASSAILAVVGSANAVIYSSAHNTAATAESIPRLTIAAISSDTGGMSFVRVTCYDAEAKVLRRGVYLRNEGLSSKPSDVQAAILLRLAASSKSDTQRQAFLQSAITDYPDSLFLPELRAALDALTAPASPDAEAPAQPSDAATDAPADTAAPAAP